MSIKDKLEEDLEKYKKVILVERSFDRKEDVLGILSAAEGIRVYVSDDYRQRYANVEVISAEDEKFINIVRENPFR